MRQRPCGVLEWEGATGCYTLHVYLKCNMLCSLFRLCVGHRVDRELCLPDTAGKGTCAAACFGESQGAGIRELQGDTVGEV